MIPVTQNLFQGLSSLDYSICWEDADPDFIGTI